MRPWLKAFNAELARKRKLAEEMNMKLSEGYIHGYKDGERDERRSRPVNKLHGASITFDSDHMYLPFKERMEFAKRQLAGKLADSLIDEIEIDHKTDAFGETWTGSIAVGGISREYVYVGGNNGMWRSVVKK